MNERDSWTVDAMENYGGSFVQALGHLARHADPENLDKIKDTWPSYWSSYETMGLEMQMGEKEKKA